MKNYLKYLNEISKTKYAVSDYSKRQDVAC